MRTKKWLGCLLAMVMLFAMGVTLAACGEEKADTVKVTFYDVRTVLKTEEVVKGGTVQEFEPTKDGYTFRGWYADAAFSNKYDFSQKILRNTSIFAKWRTETPAEDTRMWYIIGSVAYSNWQFLTEKDDTTGEWAVGKNVSSSQRTLFFEKGENNAYSITINLKEGQKFQIVTNLIDTKTWEGDEGKERMGLGNLKGFTYCDGTNPEDGELYGEDEKCYGEVRDEYGELIFIGGVEYDATPWCWNIWPQITGRYKFTFKSYPGENSDNEITWELLES